MSTNLTGSPIRGGPGPLTRADSTSSIDIITEGCYYKTAEEVLPFCMILPECKEDVKWNVACLQALDVASNFGVPSLDEDFAEPEEKGVWGEVLEGMKLPARPDEFKLDGDGPDSGKGLSLLGRKRPFDEVDNDEGGGGDGEEKDSVDEVFDSPTSVWGITKNPHAESIWQIVKDVRWKGPDDVEVPSLGPDERFVQRFRLGAERIQVGDLVRLASKSKISKMARTAMIVGKEGIEALTYKTLKSKGAASSFRRLLFETANNGAAKISVLPGQEARIELGGASQAAAIAAAKAAEIAAEAKNAYVIQLPPGDGHEFLEVSHIVVKRPKSKVTRPWEAPGGGVEPSSTTQILTSNRTVVKLVGRIYHRIPAQMVESYVVSSSSPSLRRPVLWYPTGEVRTVNAIVGEVMCRTHAQFSGPIPSSISNVGNGITSNLGIVVGGVGEGWKGNGIEEGWWDGNRRGADDVESIQREMASNQISAAARGAPSDDGGDVRVNGSNGVVVDRYVSLPLMANGIGAAVGGIGGARTGILGGNGRYGVGLGVMVDSSVDVLERARLRRLARLEAARLATAAAAAHIAMNMGGGAGNGNGDEGGNVDTDGNRMNVEMTA
ncbi:hypothetical protein HDU76_005645 [Blyttiomyces sp. JEL0837]|nr:hypothetical protein HDU76_005645 [Blyttiomyces sp. JEL0837]